MIYGSVCSGIEAASVAFAPLGWKCAFLSEIDPFPRAVLQHRFPNVPLHGDFTTIENGMYEPIDLLIGGTPCQSFSIAGLRGGMKDERGNLALEFLRLVDRLKPRYVVWENVPGVLSSNQGRDFGSFLGALAELGFGVAYRVLDAQFWGVPQRRRRVFVVGCAGANVKRAEQILFDTNGMRWHTQTRREKGEIAPTIPSKRTAGGWNGATDFECDGGIVVSGSCRNDPTAETYVPTDFDIPTISHTLGGHNLRSACEDGTGRGSPLIPIAYRTNAAGQVMPQGNRSAALTTSTDPCAQVIAFSQNQVGDVLSGNVMHNLATNGNSTGRNAPTIMEAQSGVRRLMPIEAERLQGLPEVEATRRIHVCQSCFGNRPSRAPAETLSLHAIRSVSPVAESTSPQSVKCVDQNLNTSLPVCESPVLLSVLIDCERMVVEIRNQKKPFKNVSNAEKSASFLRFTLPESIARIGVGMPTTGEIITRVGGEELQKSMTSSTALLNGKYCAEKFGHEIILGAVVAVRDISSDRAFMFITSEGGRSSQSCDGTWETLYSYVLNAINSSIPELTSSDCSYDVNLTVSSGWTLVPYHGKPSSDGPRYRAIGNSMAVPVIRWIGGRIQEQEMNQ